eukprot:640977-Amphidinium_carterae.1
MKEQSITQMRSTTHSSEATMMITRRPCLLCVRVLQVLHTRPVLQKKGAIYDSIQAIGRFIVENGSQITILQSDCDPSIIELLKGVTRQIPHLRCQQAPHYSHQSQTSARYNGEIPSDTICTLRTTRLQSHSSLLNHVVHHSVWLLNRFLRHADGKTSYERNSGREPIRSLY